MAKNEVGFGEKLQFNDMVYSELGLLYEDKDCDCLSSFIKLRNKTITSCKILVKYCPWEMADIKTQIIKQIDTDSLLYIKDVTVKTEYVLTAGYKVLNDAWSWFCEMILLPGDALQDALIDVLSLQRMGIVSYVPKANPISSEAIDQIESITFRFLAIKYHNTWTKTTPKEEEALIAEDKPKKKFVILKKKSQSKSRYTYDDEKDALYSLK